MTWIHFDASEPPVNLARLAKIAPPGFNLEEMRERLLLVLFFSHSLDCPHCREAVAEFSRRRDELYSCSAKVIVVTPSLPLDASDFLPIQILADPQHAARQEQAGLLEFDTHGKLLLFILNQYWVPSAAWVGDEADDPDLHERTLERLDYLSVQCPE